MDAELREKIEDLLAAADGSLVCIDSDYYRQRLRASIEALEADEGWKAEEE